MPPRVTRAVGGGGRYTTGKQKGGLHPPLASTITGQQFRGLAGIYSCGPGRSRIQLLLELGPRPLVATPRVDDCANAQSRSDLLVGVRCALPPRPDQGRYPRPGDALLSELLRLPFVAKKGFDL